MTPKQLFIIVTLLFLIAALPVGVYLAQKQQIFKPKASSLSDQINFVGSNVSKEGEIFFTTDAKVSVEINSPFGSPLPTQ